MKEPSFLDYLKSLINSRQKRIDLEEYLGLSSEQSADERNHRLSGTSEKKIEWQVVLGALLAIAGQYFMEPDSKKLNFAIGLYLAAGLLLWLGYRNTTLQVIQQSEKRSKIFSTDIHIPYFISSLIFLVAAFLAFRDNTFTGLNLALWFVAIVLFILAVWEPKNNGKIKKKKDAKFIILLIIVFFIAGFFRFYQLEQVPGEMFSDHAEKLLDVMDVLSGKTPIFFTRNTGREAIQFYLTAVIIKLFNSGISFLSLKLGTALAGLITIPFIYLLGRQVANKWTGLIAMFLAGIAYWPNVISRVALRFALYPLFAAPVLYFLFKGLQTRNRNDIILSGIFLGMGLHGYSPARILPIYVIVVFFIYWLHEQKTKRSIVVFWIFPLIVFSAFMLFLPLFRYFLDNPTLVSYRALSRLTSVEKTVGGSALLIFLRNLWNSSVMFFNQNGQIWVHSIPNRPALGIVSAGFLFVGLVAIIKKYLTYRNWEDLALLIAIPILMLPSTLSLAFPGENPSLNRTGGAIVPVFIIAAMGFYQFARGIFIKDENKFIRIIMSILVIVLLAFSLFQNYDLVFNQFADQFLANAWNSSEIGHEIADFIADENSVENAFVVPYAHWVDTRLVGINAGFPGRDFALWAEDFEQTLSLNGNKLFILKPEDTASLDILKKNYPGGHEEIFYSKTTGKNFIMYSIMMN